MLSPTTAALWQAYLESERSKNRRVLLSALERFIDALLGEDEADRRRWAFELAEQVSDAQADVPIRQPLAARVLVPILTEGVLIGVPGSLRWLARFRDETRPDRKMPEHLRTNIGLLKEAIRVDPTDHLARERLLDRWASVLEYSLHEIPSGVLYRNDGATIPECDELLEFLDEFRSHAEVFELPTRYASLIAYAERHFRCYRDYLVLGCPGGSYQAFLDSDRPASNDEGHTA